VNSLGRATTLAAVAIVILAALDFLLRGRWGTLVGGVILALVVVGLPRLAIRGISAWKARIRENLWAEREGRHHSVAGVHLRIEHDHRHSWVDGAGLQRAIGTHDPDDVLAARLSGRWRRDEKGELMLRVDAVVANLAQRPERMDPRVVRVRLYLEREVLFPEAQRRARR
jgi:hypothetical protein